MREYIFASNLPVRWRIPWKYTFVEASPDNCRARFTCWRSQELRSVGITEKHYLRRAMRVPQATAVEAGVVYAQMKQGTWTFKSVL